MFSRINRLSIIWLLRLATNSGAVLTLTFLYSGVCRSEVIDKTVAIVNTEAILLSDLHQLVSRLSRAAMVDDLLLLDFSMETLKKDPKLQLQFLINQKVIDSEVKRLNLSVTMDRVDQEIREIAKRNSLSKDDLLKTIQAQGIDLAEYQSFMKEKIERQSVIEQEVTSKIRLSDEDVAAYYSSAAGKTLKQTYEYTLSHIFFSPQNGGADAALTRAKKVLAEIRSGKSFDGLLAKSTEDSSSSNGGLLGVFHSGEFSSEMELAVSKLSAGEVSDIVRSRTGYHIIRVVGKKLVTDPEFEKSKEKYRTALFERDFKRQLRTWIDLKRDESTIKLSL